MVEPGQGCTRPQPGQAEEGPATGSRGQAQKPCGREGDSGPSPEEGGPQAEQEPSGQGPGAAPGLRHPIAQILLAAVHVYF